MTDTTAGSETIAGGERPRRGGARTASRLAAVQALFQISATGLDPARAVDEFRTHRLGKADVDEGQPDLAHADPGHFAAIVLGAALRADEIDALIGAVLPADWPARRIDPVLRAILRAGCFELLARDDVPVRVVVDEYVSIAHAFFSGVEAGFANAMLDALARRIRPDAFEPAHGGPSG